MLQAAPRQNPLVAVTSMADFVYITGIMKALSVITDPVYNPRQNYTAYERFWLRFIKDKRDLPFIHLLTVIHLVVLSSGILFSI